ncbi:MAG: M56 family metallopeptidase [Flavobacteriales bacterium]|nr:M56 family metallopeptidase [Flavobacteriales bacterium]
MNTFFIYLAEANLYLLLFAAMYYIWLRRQKNFNANRAVILGSLTVPFLLPLLPAGSYPEAAAEISGIFQVNLPAFVVGSSAEFRTASSGSGVFSLVQIIYFGGASVTGLLFLRQLYHTLRRAASGRTSHEGITEVTLEDDARPASFFNVLFMPKNVNAENAPFIRAHELVHIREWHSLDLILSEVVKILCWFNPAAYYLRRAAETNHEFRADALTADDDNQTYSKVLIGEALGVNHSLVGHHFNKSNLLKMRIEMLTKKQRGRSILRYALLIPFTAAAIFIHGCVENEAEAPAQSKSDSSPTEMQVMMVDGVPPIPQTGEDGIYTIVEQMPEYPGGESELMAFLGENIKYPAGAKADGEEGTVFITFTITADGLVENPKALGSDKGRIDQRLETEALKVIGSMPQWTPGQQDGKNVAVRYNLPVRFKLKD